MLNASRGCRVRTTVVIDEISEWSAFSEGVYRDGGGALSSASRVMFAGRRCGHTRVRGQRRWCPSRRLPQRCKTRRIVELIFRMSCVSMLHIRCRDFCALIIDAERSRRRLRAFARSVVLGVHRYAAGTGLPPSRGVCLFPPKADCLLLVQRKRPALVQNGCLETRRTAPACRWGHYTTYPPPYSGKKLLKCRYHFILSRRL